MIRAILIATMIAACLAQPPPAHPHIPGDFDSDVEIEVHEANATHFGTGFIASDTRGNRIAEHFEAEHGPGRTLYIFDLARYDLGHRYYINSEDPRHCNESTLTGNMRAPFYWVAQATYNGTADYHGRRLDIWTYRESSTGGTLHRVGVDPHHPDTPVISERSTPNYRYRYTWRNFIITVPRPDAFNIPPQCPHQP